MGLSKEEDKELMRLLENEEAQKEKIEEWGRQQVKYTEEILFLNQVITDMDEELTTAHNEYIAMLHCANKWKHKFLKEKGIVL